MTQDNKPKIRLALGSDKAIQFASAVIALKGEFDQAVRDKKTPLTEIVKTANDITSAIFHELSSVVKRPDSPERIAQQFQRLQDAIEYYDARPEKVGAIPPQCTSEGLALAKTFRKLVSMALNARQTPEPEEFAGLHQPEKLNALKMRLLDEAQVPTIRYTQDGYVFADNQPKPRT